MDLFTSLLLRKSCEKCPLTQVVFKWNATNPQINRTALVFKEA